MLPRVIARIDVDVRIPLRNISREIGRLWKLAVVLRDGIARQELPAARNALDHLRVEGLVLLTRSWVIADDEILVRSSGEIRGIVVVGHERARVIGGVAEVVWPGIRIGDRNVVRLWSPPDVEESTLVERPDVHPDESHGEVRGKLSLEGQRELIGLRTLLVRV